MEINNIHLGMMCGSTKGSGTVASIDGSTRTIYMTNNHNQELFEVSIDDIIDDPQAHNKEDTFY